MASFQRRWGAVLGSARRLARKAAAWVDDDVLAARIINWTACFGIALKQHLRGDKNEDEFAGLINDRQIKELLDSAHMPLFVLDAITEAVRTRPRLQVAQPLAFAIRSCC